MSSFNSKLAGDVLRSILSNEEGHRQKRWLSVPSNPEGDFTVDLGSMQAGETCGTQACIAGWAALHAGWIFEVKIDPNYTAGRSLSVINPQGEIVEENRVEVDLKEEGRVALGLNGNEAGSLFYKMEREEAIAHLYSKIKTGTLTGLLQEVEDEFNLQGYPHDPDDYLYRYNSTVIQEVLRQAQEEYSPVLDVLRTLEEPTLESVEK